MITPELLKDPDYHLALRLTEKIRQYRDDGTAEAYEDMARSSELALALYLCMKYLVKHDIPVSYDDYKALGEWFSHDDDEWGSDPYEAVDSDEAELFKQLKLADE